MPRSVLFPASSELIQDGYWIHGRLCGASAALSALHNTRVRLSQNHRLTFLTNSIRQMLSAPRYSGAVANPGGDWAVYSADSYSFETHAESIKWYLMRVSTGEITKLPFEDEVSEMVWVGPTDTSVLYINVNKNDVPGGVTLWTADLADSPVKG